MVDPGNGPRLSSEQAATWFSLLEVVDTARDLLAKQMRELGGISMVQFGILRHLAEASDGRMRMTALANAVGTSPSGMTYQIGQMLSAGLIERDEREEGGDERAVPVVIAKRGRAVLEAVTGPHHALAHELLFAPLGAAQDAQLAAISAALLERVRQVPPRASRRRSRPSKD